MKVETPQILWNAEGDSGKNAPLYSIAVLESGIADDTTTPPKYGSVMVSAGNSTVINLWTVCFHHNQQQLQQPKSQKDGDHHKAIFQKPGRTSPHKIEYMTSLTRHDMAVNTVAFSPDGLHLATAGEGGSIVIWSVPLKFRGNGNGRHFWSTVTKESDLTVRIVSTHCEGVSDLHWSKDSKRFLVGTVDHNVLAVEDKTYQTNSLAASGNAPAGGSAPQPTESEWKIVYRNSTDHTQPVQGVAYDPLGIYLASTGSDRTVRVHSRKLQPKTKKKALRPSDAPKGPHPPQEHAQRVDRMLTESRLEIGLKSKCIKYRRLSGTEESAAVKKRQLFADESTCESFFRRLSWTPDGAFLITPAALWHKDPTNMQASPSFSTYLFARHRFDEPYRVLSGLEKPSVVVRPNPILFKLPHADTSESKENCSLSSNLNRNNTDTGNLLYRSIFAVLTLDSVIIYDTYHLKPLSITRGLHYTGLTDCAWSQDGQQLLVCSTDGYISILSFENGELGDPYTSSQLKQTTQPLTPSKHRASSNVSSNVTPAQPVSIQPTESSTLPSCEPGEATLEAPPAKKMKTRIAPTLLASTSSSKGQVDSLKRNLVSGSATDNVAISVTKLSLEPSNGQTIGQPKKKKRIQPIPA